MFVIVLELNYKTKLKQYTKTGCREGAVCPQTVLFVSLCHKDFKGNILENIKHLFFVNKSPKVKWTTTMVGVGGLGGFKKEEKNNCSDENKLSLPKPEK